jgi:hypothetical protein
MSAWDAEIQLRWQYQQRIAEEHLVHVKHLADRACPKKRAAWQAAMKIKGDAYNAHRLALVEAVKSGEPYPETD